MPLHSDTIQQYYVFLASPGDVPEERRHVRTFFEDFNNQLGHLWKVRFQVVDWENHASIGVGRPQELITQQTLERFRGKLALVVGIMAQRFGSPTGKAESGTQEEFEWAMKSHAETGFPEIKWFFRKAGGMTMPEDPDEAIRVVEQWRKVLAFRKQMQDLNNPVFYTEYADPPGFAKVFDRDVRHWLANPDRPWAEARAAAVASAPPALAGFEAEPYREALRQRFDRLSFDMLDTTGAHYSGVKLWSVFVPQSVRECHQYNPRLLEIPKEHQKRMLAAGEITEEELKEAEREGEKLRTAYFQQPIRPVLDVVDEALGTAAARGKRRLVILGDPGAGKSSLVRYLALRWARVDDPTMRDAQPVPLVIELGKYARWECEGRKGFVRYLEEAPNWCDWPCGVAAGLLSQPGRAVLLLDGLDEVFDVRLREAVIDDLHRFCVEHPDASVVLTSRVVGYQPQRLRDAEFRHFMLQDLDSPQIASFVDRWHAETFAPADREQADARRERLMKSIANSKSIAMLAGNPLLLTMMAVLNRHSELPRERAELYRKASEVLLHQWDTERALVDFPGLSAEIGLREKTEILRRVAYHMQASPDGLQGNLIAAETLEQLVEEYLCEKLRFTQARAAARAVIEHLRMRNFILCFVGADSYAFVHRTFLEYYCAAEFVHRFNVSKMLDAEGLYALFDEHRRQDEWREVLRLICGQIDETFVGHIVIRLADEPNHRHSFNPERPELLLAIGCLSEARNLVHLEEAGKILLNVLLGIYVPGTGGINLLDRLLAAQEEIGPRWPGTESVWETILSHENDLGEEWSGVYIVRFLSCVRPDRKRVEAFLKSRNGSLRHGSIESLAKGWPDDRTRDLLADRAIRDDHAMPRCAALQSLAGGWPDDWTRDLLTARADEDSDPGTRSFALKLLASCWPDGRTRDLLTARAVEDTDPGPRREALQALVDGWRDDRTHDLLTARAAEDTDPGARVFALQALVKGWPDDQTRDLLAARAVGDVHAWSRITAIRLLAEGWRDERTRKLLSARMIEDTDLDARVEALRALGEICSDANFGWLLLSHALDGGSPYIDPLKPITREHIQNAAAKLGISADRIESEVALLSKFLGWDLTRGPGSQLKEEPPKKPSKKRRKSE